MAKTLSGKVALVTGGSRSIGAAIARRLAKDGAAVAITYVGSQQMAGEVVGGIKAKGGRGLAIHGDSMTRAEGGAQRSRHQGGLCRAELIAVGTALHLS